MTVFARPGSAGALMSFESRYDNFIGGEWVAPVAGRYFENLTPVTGQPFCEVARSDADDIEKALDAAHGGGPGLGQDRPRRAGRDPEQDRRPDRSEPGLAGAGRSLGQRQTDPGDAGRRHPVGR